MKFILKSIIFLYFIIFGYTCYSQSLSVFDVDASNFPTIKAKFYAFDKDGNQITNLSPSDFELMENGARRNVTVVSCPTPKPPEALSSVLVIDVSGSMGCPVTNNILLAKEAGKAWVLGLPNSRPWECSITAFDNRNYLIKDFTNDRTDLLNSIEKLTPNGGTNYDAAFIDQSAGGIRIAETGKYKRVLVFLSDGQPNFEPQTSRIINEARQAGIIVYAVTLRMSCHQSLKDISTQTGGQWFENVTTVEEARAIYLRILQLAQNSGEPCEIQWESDYSCDISREVDLFCKPLGLNSTLYYNAPNTIISKIKIVPDKLYVGEVVPPQTKDTIISIQAINRDINISNIITNNPRFTIVNYGGAAPPFKLGKNQTRNITIRYTAPDSGFVSTWMEITSDACYSERTYLSAGFKEKIANNSLRLVHPNGGEEFLVGIDTVFIWEGVLPTDTVKLEYSTDAGITWNLITDKATGLKYVWKGVPNTPSKKCLGRVTSDRFIKLPDSSGFFIGNNSTIAYIDKYYVGQIDGKKTSFTFEAWIKVKGFPQNWFNIFDNGWRWELTNSALYFTVQPTIYIPFNYMGYLNKWVHHAITYDALSDTFKYYINGSEVYSNNISLSLNEIYYQDKFYIGYGPSGAIECSYGYIDEFRVWTKNLSENEINDFMFKKLLGNENNLLIYIDFNHTSSSQIKLNNTFTSFSDDVPILDTTTTNLLDFSDSLWSIVKPDLASRDVNFGNVCIGSYKDTVLLSYLTNSGTFPFIIDSIKISGTNAQDFYLVSEFAPPSYPLAPQETKILEIGFKPSAAGLRTADLNIYSGINKFIQKISGLGTNKSINVITTNINFGDVKIKKYKDTTITVVIENTSNKTINIIATNIIGISAEYYSIISGGGSFSLAPGEKREITVRFSPKELSRVQAYIEFVTNDDCQNSFVELFGKGIPNGASILSTINQSGNLICETFANDTIQISNTGGEDLIISELNITGTNKNDFEISETLPITIPPDSTKTIVVIFKPQTVGDKSAYLEIKSNADPDSVLTKQLNGRKESVEYSTNKSELDFGYLPFNKSSELEFEITNKGTLPNTYKLSAPAFITLSEINFTLNPNESKIIKVFYPGNPIPTNILDSIIIEELTCKITKKVNLLGTVYSATAQLKTIELSGYAGEEIEVPIILNEAENLTIAGVNAIDVELTFNPTLLAPIGYNVEKIDDKTAKIKIADLPANKQTGEVLGKIKCVVGLGNVEGCELRLSNPNLKGGTANISLINGKFTLLGICEEGGKRLINPSRVTKLLQISPNPSDGNVNIELNLVEKGATTLKIYNLQGMLVEHRTYNKVGKISFTLETQNYTNGLYFVELQTPTVVKREKLLISK